MKKIIIFFLFIFITLPGLKSSGYVNDKPSGPSSFIPFEFPDLQPPVFKEIIYDIRNQGAKPGNDTTFLNTEAINNAIIECNKAGGGKVLIPAGVWLTGPIHLKSNVNLHLEDGAELRFSKNHEDY